MYGLGKLGLPLAALLADHHVVTGVDPVEKVVAAVERGISPVVEPGLGDRVTTAWKVERLSARTEPITADVSFVIVPTPSRPDGSYEPGLVEKALTSIEHVNAPGHIAVIVSTLSPGTTARLQEDFPDLRLVYSPEFIALGSVIHDMRHPDLVLLGVEDTHDCDHVNTVIDMFRSIQSRDAADFVEERVLTFTEAELVKIAVNTFVTMKISFANTISEMCDRVPNSDARDVLEAIGLDHRIGKHYLRSGGAFGGPCFPRDSRAFRAAAQALDSWASLATATDVVNSRQLGRVHGLVREVEYGTRVAVLGIAYKPGTPVAEESFGLNIAHQLLQSGLAKHVTLWDPDSAHRNVLVRNGMLACGTIEQAVIDADVIIIVNDDERCVPPHQYLHRARRVIDVWRVINPFTYTGDNLVTFGVGPRP